MTQEIKFETKLIREPIKYKSDDWQETFHKWHIMLNGQEFDYYTGIGHRTHIRPHARNSVRSPRGLTYDELKHKNLTETGFRQLLELSKPTRPTLDDVLYALVMDSDAAETTFSDWCSNLGYNIDSRKALLIYEACQQNTDKLRKAGIDIAAHRKRLQDY